MVFKLDSRVARDVEMYETFTYLGIKSFHSHEFKRNYRLLHTGSVLTCTSKIYM